MVIIDESTTHLDLSEDGDLTLITDDTEAAVSLDTADLAALIVAATAALAARAA
jgi:hypothetical protein